MVGGRAGLQDLSVCVFVLDLPDLPQQGIQMLNERTKARNIVSVTLNPVYMNRNYKQNVDEPFLTDQLYRCQGQSTLVFEANWSPYPYRHSTKPREEKELGLMLTNQTCSINRSTLTAVGRRADSPLPATEAMLLQTSL